MKILSISEKLLYATIQLKCYKNRRQQISLGTGFIYGFCKKENSHCAFLVTNRNVVENAEECELIFHLANEDGSPSLNNTTCVVLGDFSKQCIYHPNTSIDLAIFNISQLINEYQSKGFKIFYSCLDSSLIPSSKDIEYFSTVEDIIMIGYPNGLRDNINNFPIIRKGITATPYFVNFNGEQKFLGDIACYPGSSGSPVIILQEGFAKDRYGNVKIGMGSKVFLLGINSSVYLNSVTGNIVEATDSETNKLKTHIEIPNNLAIIIKSENLLDFEVIVRQIIEKQSNAS